MKVTRKDFDFPLRWVQDDLALAQKQFAKNPNSANWNACLRMMMAHQQLTQAMRNQAIWDKLYSDLERSHREYWQDLICLNTLGMSCADALNKA